MSKTDTEAVNGKNNQPGNKKLKKTRRVGMRRLTEEIITDWRHI